MKTAAFLRTAGMTVLALIALPLALEPVSARQLPATPDVPLVLPSAKPLTVPPGEV